MEFFIFANKINIDIQKKKFKLYKIYKLFQFFLTFLIKIITQNTLWLQIYNKSIMI